MHKAWDTVPGIGSDVALGSIERKPDERHQEPILGDSFSTFERSIRPGNRYLIAGFLCVVLLAGAVGGGLGGGLAAQKRQ
jgi:hypothetical protein